MNSSPPLISPEISGIGWNLGETGEIQESSGQFRGIQWNSVGVCMALNMNPVGIPRGFRGNAEFSGKKLGFGVVSGDFTQIANLRWKPIWSFLRFPLSGNWVWSSLLTAPLVRELGLLFSGYGSPP